VIRSGEDSELRMKEQCWPLRSADRVAQECPRNVGFYSNAYKSD